MFQDSHYHTGVDFFKNLQLGKSHRVVNISCKVDKEVNFGPKYFLMSYDNFLAIHFFCKTRKKPQKKYKIA
jgi:hypothetical protein